MLFFLLLWQPDTTISLIRSLDEFYQV